MKAFADALRDRYVLERELGRGGMAVVYLARDVFSRHWLRIDLTLAPLRTNPRFIRLVSENPQPAAR
jgi:hypothetical protein